MLVKKMVTLEIALMDGREIAIRTRMNKVDAPDEWTDMSVSSVDFDVDLAASIFTLSNLRNPRQ